MKPTAQDKKVVNELLNWLNRQFPGSKARIERNMVKQSQLGSTLFDDLDFNADLYASAATPQIYSGNATGNGGVVNESNSWLADTVNSISEAAKTVLPAYTNYKLQKDAYEIQMQRAKRGQEPLDLSRYGAAPVRVQVAPPPGYFTPDINDDTKNTLMIGAGLVALLFLINKAG